MSSRNHVYTPASVAAFRWLTDPGPQVPTAIRGVLLKELFSPIKVTVIYVCSGLLLDGAANWMSGEVTFRVLIFLSLMVGGWRLVLARRLSFLLARDLPTPTDLYIASTTLWGALQGVFAFAALHTGIAPLSILATAAVTGTLSPIHARNYAAPRFAFLLTSLAVVPLVAGAALSGNRWLMLMLPEGMLFLPGSWIIIMRLQRMAVSALQSQHESHQRALHDPLTGLLNRFGLSEALDERPARTGERMVLFYLDLDGFKQINDQFGHQAGDELLKAVADRLRGGTRNEDTVARLGGDEFLIVAHDMSPDDGAGFAQDVIRRITDEPILIGDRQSVIVGVSIGFACAPEDGVTLDELRKKADEALYQSKAAGKGVLRRYNRRSAKGSPADSMMERMVSTGEP